MAAGGSFVKWFRHGLGGKYYRNLAHHTGQENEKVHHDSDRDYYMTADEAKAYGLVDEVVKSRRELPAALTEVAPKSE